MFFSSHRTHSPRVYLRALRIRLLPIRKFSRRVQARGKSILRAVGNGLLVVARFWRNLLRSVFIGIRAGIEWPVVKFWHWQPIAFVVALLVGAGISAMYGDQYDIAKALYFLAIGLTLAKLITETKNYVHRASAVSVLVIMAISLFGGSIEWIKYRQLQVAKAKATQEQRVVASTQIPSAPPPLTPGPMMQEQVSPTPAPPSSSSLPPAPKPHSTRPPASPPKTKPCEWKDMMRGRC